MSYFTTSAKTGKNINEIFDKMGLEIYNKCPKEFEEFGKKNI